MISKEKLFGALKLERKNGIRRHIKLKTDKPMMVTFVFPVLPEKI